MSGLHAWSIIAATDPTLLVQIERHLKQALVDKNCFVAASALSTLSRIRRPQATTVSAASMKSFGNLAATSTPLLDAKRIASLRGISP